MAQAGPPPEDWDIDWKYTDGPLENFGWAKQIVGRAASEMKADGLYISSSGGYVKYACPVITCKKAAAEYEFRLITVPEAGGGFGSGFRPILSDGNSGVQIFTNERGFVYSVSNSTPGFGGIVLAPSLLSDHTLRIEYAAGCNNKVFIDEQLAYEGNEFSTYYVSANSIFQQSGGETILKALRYKFIER